MTAEERSYIAHLRLRALSGESLSPEESFHVARYVHEIEKEEAERLAPHFAQCEQKIVVETEREQQLRQLLERERAIFIQLQKIVEEIQAIDSERQRLVSTVPL